MANQEQLEILKQGVEVWNKWREENQSTPIEFVSADLREFDLRKYNLSHANLMGADLSRSFLIEINLDGSMLNWANLFGCVLKNANLRGADLSEARITHADIRWANLDETIAHKTNFMAANLQGASLRESHLIEAELNRTDLQSVDFYKAYLTGANLDTADLSSAKLRETNLWGADLGNAQISNTQFLSIDLSQTIGLEKTKHFAPSLISTDTIQLSKGRIPETFLRGCGLSDLDIAYSMLYSPTLSNEEINKIVYKLYDLRATQPIQISPLFISYSHADSAFVDKVETFLNEKGIRFWRDIHDMKSGRIERQIDRAMRLNPTVLLILSKDSLQSDWVEHEARTARTIEKEIKRDVICPVALDDSWKNSSWAKRITEQIMEYNILDFSEWKDDAKFESTFNKLIDGLELFYK